MLCVFYGADSERVRQVGWETIKTAAGDSTPTIVDDDGYAAGMIHDFAGAASLFGDELSILLDATKSQDSFLAEIIDAAPALAASTNNFVLIADKLLAAQLKKIASHAKHIEEYKAGAAARLDVFALADYFAARDKKNLWLHYQHLTREGVPAEELIGILWWQLKSLRLAAATASIEEAGLKPFVYNKAKRALAKFKAGELETLSASLLTLYHQGHGGATDIDAALELWLLEV